MSSLLRETTDQNIASLSTAELEFVPIDADTSVPGQVTFNNHLITDFDIFHENGRRFPELVFEVSQITDSAFNSDVFRSAFGFNNVERYIFADGLTLPVPLILQFDGESVGSLPFVLGLDFQSSTDDVWAVIAPDYGSFFSEVEGVGHVVLTGGGNDTVYIHNANVLTTGGNGNDTYIYDGAFPLNGALTGETAESGENDTVIFPDLDPDLFALAHDVDSNSLSIARIEAATSGFTGLLIENPENIENIIFGDGMRIENLILGDNFAIDHPRVDGLKYLYGTDENEWIIAGLEGRRDLYAHGGDDVVYGNADRNNMNGGDGNDILYGGSSNDVLNGADGDDILYGQRGDDVYLGGAGADTFVLDFSDFDVFNSAQNVEFRNNRLRDFDPDEGDVISFEGIFGSFDPLSEAIGDFIQLGERSGKSTLLIDRDGAGTFSDFQQMVLFETQTGGALQVDFTVEDLFVNGNLEIV